MEAGRLGRLHVNFYYRYKGKQWLHLLKTNFLEITFSFVLPFLIKIYLVKRIPHKLTQTQQQMN